MTTKVWDGAAYRAVDKWDLTQVYPETGDYIAPAGNDTSPNLWLQTITHTGYAADGTTSLAEPTMSFGGARLANRVDWGDDIGVAPYMHYRLTSVADGTGGQTVVSYSGTECVRSFKPNPQSNPYRCFPQYFVPQQASPGWGWFHKYVVTQVVDRDLTGASPDQVTAYAYSTEGSTDHSLWHHDYAETVQLAYRSWSLWRGYTTVTVTEGGAGGTQTVTRTLYHRGMDGDGMATADNSAMSWGSRRANLATPIATPGISAAIAGQGGRCLDLAGTANGSNIRLYSCNGASSQVWQVHNPQSDGRFTLRNPASGRCLDITGAATANGSDTQLWDCNSLPQQWWQRQPNGSLRNPAAGRCLEPANWGTSDGVNIQIFDCGGHWNQVWQPQANGGLVNPQANRCMDVAGAATADGTKIQSWTCNGLPQQVWQLQTNGTLRNPASNKCADITDGATANGALIRLFTCNGGPGQIWVLQAGGALRNPQSGRCLDVHFDAANGTQLRIWDCSGASQQQWLNRLTDVQGLQGQVREEFTMDGATVLESSIHEYTVNQTALRSMPVIGGQDMTARMTRETNTRTRTWLAHSSIWRWTETQTSYDSYGLPTDVRDLGDTATGNDDTCEHTDYARNTTAWLIDFPSAETITDCTASPGPANTLGATRSYYDGSTVLGAAPTRGLLTQTSELASYTGGTTANWITTATNTYDTHGRLLTVKDGLNRTTTTSYTPTTGGPVTSVALTDPAGHTDTSALNIRGDTTSEVDSNNKTTVGQYDALGRLTKVWLPGRTTAQTPNTEYAYFLSNSAANWVQTKQLGPNGNQIISYEIYDGHDRLRQVQLTAPDGKRVVGDVRYDSRDMLVKESVFYNSASAPTGTLVTFADADVATQRRYAYDALERPTEEALWSLNTEKWRTTASYDGDRVNVDPPQGGTATTALQDAHGRTTALRQFHGGAPTGTYDATTYSYDRLDRLIAITDPVGNVWGRVYDRLDRLTSESDPDAGPTTYSYDEADQLVTTTDASGDVLYRIYDGLGRQTELREGNATGPKRASWIYDTVAKGELTSATRWVGNDAYTKTITGYNDLYQPTGITTTIPAAEGALAGDYTTTATYKPDGSMATIVHPAKGGLPAETVTYAYTDTGLVTSAAGIDTYLASAAYHWHGAIRQQILGTGDKQVRLTATIDDATGRLTKSEVHAENPSVPETWDEKLTELYSYDPIGNVLAINETSAGATVSQQCFGYDYLRRLTESWTTTASTCQATPSQAVVGGPDPYWQSFTYDKVGNRLTDTRHTASGATTRTYAYPAAGSPRPHTLSSVTTSGGGPTNTYTYDTSGNLATKITTGLPNQTFTFDPEGHLASVLNGADTHEYLYDADGNRLLVDDPGATTLYVDDTEYRLNRTTNQVTATRYYANAVRTATGLAWIANDHHGTGQLAFDAATLSSTRRRLTPFGEARGTPPTNWPDQKGFVRGTSDPTGYTHLGAREYDPTTGRFLSVDPIIDYEDPQTMNGYSYANNSPVTYTDPDGRAWRPDAGGGGGGVGGGGGGGGASVGNYWRGGVWYRGGGSKAKPRFSGNYRGSNIKHELAEMRAHKAEIRAKTIKAKAGKPGKSTKKGPGKATGKKGTGKTKGKSKRKSSGKKSTAKKAAAKKSASKKGGQKKRGGGKKGNPDDKAKPSSREDKEDRRVPPGAEEALTKGDKTRERLEQTTDVATYFGTIGRGANAAETQAPRAPPGPQLSAQTQPPAAYGTELFLAIFTTAINTVRIIRWLRR